MLPLLLGVLLARPAAADAELSRAQAGLTLGLKESEVRQLFKAADAAKESEEPLLKGEKLLRLTPVPAGAQRLLARFRDGRLWCVTVLFPLDKAPRPWGEFLDAPSQLYGPPRHSEGPLASVNENRAEWSDERTRLLYLRREGVSGARDSIRLEDLGLLGDVTHKALEGAVPPPSMGSGCATFPDCLESGRAKFGDLDCAGAMEDWDRARALNPGDAHVYYFRSVVWRLVGREPAAKADFARALLITPELRERGDGFGGPKVQLGRKCLTVPPTAP